MKFPPLGHAATVPDIMRLSPEAGRPLFEMHDHGNEELYKRRGQMLKEHGYLPLIGRL